MQRQLPSVHIVTKVHILPCFPSVKVHNWKAAHAISAQAGWMESAERPAQAFHDKATESVSTKLHQWLCNPLAQHSGNLLHRAGWPRWRRRTSTSSGALQCVLHPLIALEELIQTSDKAAHEHGRIVKGSEMSSLHALLATMNG